MAVTNHERIGTALRSLKAGLLPFVEREMRGVYGDRWMEEVRAALSTSTQNEPLEDVHALLGIVWFRWGEVFKRVLGNAERAYVSELREVRNLWAHQHTFTTNDTVRYLDTIARLLTAIGAPEAADVERMHAELQRTQIDEQARQQVRRLAARPTEGQPLKELRPWRELVTPHPDVSSGRYQQAEFAADLRKVMEGTASSEYGDPVEFFQRTYLTEGLRLLCTKALNRLAGQGGDPVVELQTNFGGGKTHSMLTLYHLFSGARPHDLLGVDDLVQEAEAGPPTQSHRAVLVGTALSPGQPSEKGEGTLVHTLWGELAWQLGGSDGYAMVQDADRTGTNPGSDALRRLFQTYSPTLILIDEFVAYVRQLYGRDALPGGTFDSVLSFTQSLTEAAAQVERTMVVVSVPASDIETGGEGGQAALARLKNILSRVEATWKPASTEEGYEIVRRRLFLPMRDPEAFRARDAVIASFSRVYREQAQEFPSAVGEAAYTRRMEQAYPIHPALFDQLYNAWSTVDRFQRTRGVLRLMAMTVHAMWERGDQGLMILPSMMPIDSPDVQSELTRYLEDRWTTAIERDVDGPNSLPLAVDKENANLGRYSAARRVSRTIYMGTAPLVRAATPGIDARTIRLGCVQPGENPAIFDDALRRLAERAIHLYQDGSRYWYSTQPSVTSLAQDRSGQWEPYLLWEEVQRRLQSPREPRGVFAAVHVFPEGSGDVPDEQAARLVVLSPANPHTGNTQNSAGIQAARGILDQRGPAARYHRNMLLFLAADAPRVPELEGAGRLYLAWQSIVNDAETLNLTPFQLKQAQSQLTQWDRTVRDRLYEAFTWLLIPAQPDPKGEMTWETYRLTGSDNPYQRASKKAISLQAVYTEYAPALLAQDVLRKFYWPDQQDIELGRLWEHLTNYLYMPRLKDADVLVGAIQTALGLLINEDFAYAERWDDSETRYLNLRFQGPAPSTLAPGARLVRPDIALAQLRADEARRQSTLTPEPTDSGLPGPTPASGVSSGPAAPDPPRPTGPRRFHASVTLNPLRLGRDVDAISQEVLAHLAARLGADVTVTLEIHATFKEDVPDNVVRTVEENSRTLHFRTAAFERE